MCSGHFPDNIIVCPACKRDDESYKSGLSDAHFEVLGDGLFRCVCGCVFSPAGDNLTLQAAGRNV